MGTRGQTDASGAVAIAQRNVERLGDREQRLASAACGRSREAHVPLENPARMASSSWLTPRAARHSRTSDPTLGDDMTSCYPEWCAPAITSQVIAARHLHARCSWQINDVGHCFSGALINPFREGATHDPSSHPLHQASHRARRLAMLAARPLLYPLFGLESPCCSTAAIGLLAYAAVVAGAARRAPSTVRPDDVAIVDGWVGGSAVVLVMFWNQLTPPRGSSSSPSRSRPMRSRRCVPRLEELAA